MSPRVALWLVFYWLYAVSAFASSESTIVTFPPYSVDINRYTTVRDGEPAKFVARLKPDLSDPRLEISWSKSRGPGTVTFSSPNSLTTDARFSEPGFYTLTVAIRRSWLQTEAGAATDFYVAVLPRDLASDSIRFWVPPASQYAGPLQEILLDGSIGTLHSQRQTDGTVQVNFEGLRNWTLEFRGPAGAPLKPGVYSDDGDSTNSTLLSPKLRIRNEYQDMILSKGSFTVHQITYGADGAVTSLWLTFAQEAYSTSWMQNVLLGEIKIGTEQFPPSGNQPPWIQITEHMRLMQPGLTRLTAVGGDDADGAKVVWSKVSGPGTVTFSQPGGWSTDASLPVPGKYVLRATISDGQFSAFDEIEVDVTDSPQDTTVNLPPSVSVAPHLRVSLASSAVLIGTVSDDSSPQNPLSIQWEKVTGPGTVLFTTANSQSTSATFSLPGKYRLRLTVSDGEYSAHSEVAVTVYDPAEASWMSLERSIEGFPSMYHRIDSSNGDFWIWMEEGRVNVIAVNNTQLYRFAFAAPHGAPLGLHKYQNAVVSSHGYLDTPALEVNLSETHVASGSGEFEIKKIVYGASGEILSLRATFRQYAPKAGVDVTGEIAYRPNLSTPSVNQAPVIQSKFAARALPARPHLLLVSGGDDATPDTMHTVQWTKLAGPGDAVFTPVPWYGSTLSGAVFLFATEVAFDTPGIYRLQCEVSDGERSTTSEMEIRAVDPAENTFVALQHGVGWQTCHSVATSNFAVVPEGRNALTFHAWDAVSYPFYRPGDSYYYGSVIVAISLPEGQELLPGTYENATAQPDPSKPGPVLQLLTHGPGPHTVLESGSFTIRQLERSEAGEIRRLWVTFEQWSKHPPSTKAKLEYAGELRFDVDGPRNAAPRVSAGPNLFVIPGQSFKIVPTVSDDGFPFRMPITTGRRGKRYYEENVQEFSLPGEGQTFHLNAPGRYVLEFFASDSFETGSDSVVVNVLPVTGPLTGELLADDQNEGFLKLAFTSGGAFTASAMVRGELVRFHGVLSENAQWAGTVPLGSGGSAEVEFTIANDGSFPGSISVDGTRLTFSLTRDLPPRFWKNSPPPPGGWFPFALRSDTSAQPVLGSGVGMVFSHPSGRVIYRGVLPDGTRFAGSSRLDEHWSFPVQSRLYKRSSGALTGRLFLTHEDELSADLAGAVRWSRPELPLAGTVLESFSRNLSIAGSREKLHDQEGKLLPSPLSGQQQFEAASMNGTLLSAEVSLANGSLMVDAPQAGHLRIRRSDRSLLRLQFVDPQTNTSFTGWAVMLPRFGIAEGFYLGETAAGTCRLGPAPQ